MVAQALLPISGVLLVSRVVNTGADPRDMHDVPVALVSHSASAAADLQHDYAVLLVR